LTRILAPWVRASAGGLSGRWRLRLSVWRRRRGWRPVV